MAKVTFLGIGIQNLGPFRERQYLDLQTTAGKPIVLVRALNGSGKTTLLTSLQIVLYGAKVFGNGKGSEYEQLLRGLQRSDAQGKARIDLDLRLEAHGEIDDVTVSREWTVSNSRFVEQLNIHRAGECDAQMTDEWDEFLDGILPAELAQLFLFDGEKIESLANPSTLPEMLKRATEAFLGIGGIDTLFKDLVAVERRTLLKSKGDSLEFEGAQQELQKLAQHRTELDEKLDVLKQSVASANELVDAERKVLARFTAGAERSGLASFEKASELRAEEQLARQRLAEAQGQVREALTDPWSAMSKLGGLWERYAALWEEEQDTRAAKHLLGEIVKRDQRILKKVSSAVPAEALSAFKTALTQDAKNYKDAADRSLVLVTAEPPAQAQVKIDSAQTRYVAALATLEAAQTALTTCERKLAGIPQGEQIAELLAQMQQHSATLAGAEAQLAAVTAQYDEHANSRVYIEARVVATTERLSKEFRGLAHEGRAMEAAQRSRAVLALFKDRLLASKAQWLADMITSEFAELMRKRKLFSRVNVDPATYAVSIIAPDGYELPMSRLSAGERQLLAIAVLSALIRERKGQFPVVVDTPLARLDRTHRRALIQRFFSRISHQVMVLSTDEEVEGDIFDEMSRFTSQAYLLEFSDETRSTTAGPLNAFAT